MVSSSMHLAGVAYCDALLCYCDVLSCAVLLQLLLLLQDIEAQFIRVGRRGESPWVLGIGNKDTDAKAYQMCNIRPENIFIVQVVSGLPVWWVGGFGGGSVHQ